MSSRVLPPIVEISQMKNEREIARYCSHFFACDDYWLGYAYSWSMGRHASNGCKLASERVIEISVDLRAGSRSAQLS